MIHEVHFNALWSTADEQKSFWSMLPRAHAHGDRSTTLADGRVLVGKTDHDAYASPELRVRTRRRCTVIKATEPLTVCFLSTTDWHGTGLDAETMFLRPATPTDAMPRIGPYNFYFGVFAACMYEDIVMSLMALKKTLAGASKAHIKIVPLGVGPTVRTRFGDYLGPLTIPAYVSAMQYACNSMIDDTWVETLEFIDHARGALTPYVSISRVRVMSCSVRDALDFEGSRGVPMILAPCDSFCRIGGLETDKSIASTLVRGAKLRHELEKEPAFVPWPVNAHHTQHATQPVSASV